MTEELLSFCECGCGQRVSKVGNIFIHNHHMRGKKSPKKGIHLSTSHKEALKKAWENRSSMTDETKLKMSKSQTKRQKDQNVRDEQSTKLKKVHKDNPEIWDAAIEMRRGGFDLVWHHIAYNFNDPNALRVRITRKFHGQIHSPKGLPVTERGYSLID